MSVTAASADVRAVLQPVGQGVFPALRCVPSEKCISVSVSATVTCLMDLTL